MIRTLIIEDEIIIARFIEQQLQRYFHCHTCLAVSLSEARAAMDRFLPHLLLCDINLEDTHTGIELVAELRQQYAFEVIYITSYQSHNMIKAASATHPANYLIKPVDEAQLFAGVQLVINRCAANPELGKRLVTATTRLNETEYQIVQLIRQKKTTREIAQLLHLSPYTIKNHRHNICSKLGLENKNNALLQWALQQTEIK